MTPEQLINDVLGFLPEKWRGWVIVIFAVSPYLTRAFYALKNNGGIKGVLCAIWLGTNAPQNGATSTPQISTDGK